jgi:cysteine synthase
VCAQKGYPLVVTMAESFSIERRKLMRFFGGKVVLTPAAERGIGMVNKAIELAEAHGWFLTRQFENEANPDMHSRGVVTLSQTERNLPTIANVDARDFSDLACWLIVQIGPISLNVTTPGQHTP